MDYRPEIMYLKAERHGRQPAADSSVAVASPGIAQHMQHTSLIQ